MTRIMYDSTTAADVPKSATMALGYLDGAYRTVAALKARKPRPVIVTTTVNGSTPGAHVIDRETGDATPAGAARWALAENKAGRLPTVYTYLSGVKDVLAALAAIGLGRDDVLIFTAHYTGRPHFCGRVCLLRYGKLAFRPRVIATQYANPDFTKHHYDLSLVHDYWPGVDPEPAPKPPKVQPLSRWQRALIRRVTRLLNATDDLTTDDRKAVAGLDAAALHALGGKP